MTGVQTCALPICGLDVASAHLIRDVVMRMNRERGTTVFLTTHNIDEADALCHRVAIIAKSRIAAIDTPKALRASIQSRRSVEVRFANSALDARELVELTPGMEIVTLADGFRVYGPEPGLMAQQIAARADERGIRIEAIATLAPSLEEVFLHVTRAASQPAGPRPS